MFKLFKIFCLLLLFIAVSTYFLTKPSSSYLPSHQELDLKISLTDIMEEYGVIGCSLTVIKNKKNIFNYNYGFADLDNYEEMNNDHSMRIASISKLISTILLLKTVNNHPEIITSSVSSQLDINFINPNFPQTPITIENLLTHTSSFYPYLTPAQKFIESSIYNQEVSLADIISKDGKYYRNYFWDKHNPPGTKYAYSGYNYLIIAAILEKLSGQRYDQLVQNLLLNELNLSNTHPTTTTPISKTKYALGYNFIDSVPTASLNDNNFSPRYIKPNYTLGVNPTIHAPQSGFRSNLKDLSTLMIMLLNNGKYKQKQYLLPQNIKKLETVYFKDKTIHRGLGTEINYYLLPGLKMIGHTGYAYGILSHFFYNRENDFGIIFLINGLRKNNFDNDHLWIEKDITRTIYNKIFDTEKTTNSFQ